MLFRAAFVALATYLFACPLQGCVRIPSSDRSYVPVNEVVKRVKCELFLALREKSRENESFRFLTQWAAKVHFTLTVDDTTAINPGATIIDPLARAGTSFSFGIGAGLTTEAVRQEDIEFFVSYAAMAKEFSGLSRAEFEDRYSSCDNDQGFLLESDLDLKGTLDKALAPVGEKVLNPGPIPHIGSSPPARRANELDKINTTMRLAEEVHVPAFKDVDLKQFAKDFPLQSTQLELAAKNFKEQRPVAGSPTPPKNPEEEKQKIAADVIVASAIETNARDIVRGIIDPLYDIASTSAEAKCLDKVTAAKYATVVHAAGVAYHKIAVLAAESSEDADKALKEERAEEKETRSATQEFVESLQGCGPPEKKAIPEYDPIDVISETINFFITKTGSATPIWKLVRVSAPLAPTFVSATQKNTDTLIIALGRPTVNDAGQATGGSKPMDNQILSSILSQAIASQPH